MLLGELREILLMKLHPDLSADDLLKIHHDIRQIMDMLSKQFEIPRASLFLLKDDQLCSDELTKYVNNL